jgi:broad specificity phosphatase PhoE
MKSFAHFHELLVDSSSSSSSSFNTKDDSKNSKNPDDFLSCYWANHHNEDESMEQVNRKSTPVEKLLHQQVKHSFNSTYSSSDDHDDNDDEDEDDEDDSSCSTTCSDDTSTITMPTSNRITTTTTTTKQQPIRQTNTNKQSSLQKEIINASRFSVWRSTYNSKIMPNQVILVRHGQSEGNVNEAIYAEKPDSEISLTKLGWEQAKMAGRALKQEIFNRQYGVSHHETNTTTTTTAARVNDGTKSSIHFIVSPYVRTMETFHGLVSAWCDPDVEFAHWENDHERKMLWYSRLKEMGITWHEDPRIREQDFGNYQEQHVIDKAKVERHKFGAFYYRFPNGESASDVYDRASTFLDSLWRSFDANRSQNYVLGK